MAEGEMSFDCFGMAFWLGNGAMRCCLNPGMVFAIDPITVKSRLSGT